MSIDPVFGLKVDTDPLRTQKLARMMAAKHGPDPKVRRRPAWANPDWAESRRSLPQPEPPDDAA